MPKKKSYKNIQGIVRQKKLEYENYDIGVKQIQPHRFITDKRADQLDVGERSKPKTGGRYKGLGVGRDINGYFVYNRAMRSLSYNQPYEIPDVVIKIVKKKGDLVK